MTDAQIWFLVLATMALIGALGVVVLGDKPVWSAVSLVFNFVVLAAIYFLLGNQFLGITQVMVYAGAIMVLFLFVIMILRITGQSKTAESKPWTVPVAAVVGFAVGLPLLAVIFPLNEARDTLLSPDQIAKIGRPQEIGAVLFSQYAWPFEVASMLLLIGVVGSILLAKRRLH